MDIDTFINQSILIGTGYIFVYHGHHKVDVSFNVEPSIILSYHQFKENRDLLDNDVLYHIVPLLLYYGKSYKIIKELCLLDWKLGKPLITNDEDLHSIIELCHGNENSIYIIHPRSNDQLLKSLSNVYTFEDDLIMNRDTHYHIVLLLLSHGNHYYDFIEKISLYKKEGYQIEIEDALLYCDEIREYIVKRI